MDRGKVSREQLFVMVWERPATEVARELGLSDVGLGKLCRRLQVLKPPRGYWARVQAGRTPKRPPLEAFRAELAGTLPPRPGVTPLSRRRRAWLGEALADLAAAGVDTTGCDLVRDGFRSITPDLAAQVIVRGQSRYAEWTGEDDPPGARQAAQQSAAGLIDTLLPLAKEQVVVLRRRVPEPKDAYRHSDDRLAVILRLSADLQRDVVRMHQLARDAGLAYAARSLTREEHAVAARYLRPPAESLGADVVLCVSDKELWVAGTADHWRHGEWFETDRLPVSRIVPIDLLPPSDRRLPGVVGRTWLRPYARRLKALRDADKVVDLVSGLTFAHDNCLDDAQAALADRLLVGSVGEGPFTEARRRLRLLEAQVEQWEEAIACEKAAFCREVLGIGPGDTVVFEAGGKPARMDVTEATVHVSDDDVLFDIRGRRYRKDGLPGKRDEVVTLRVENDTVETLPAAPPPEEPSSYARRFRRWG